MISKTQDWSFAQTRQIAGHRYSNYLADVPSQREDGRGIGAGRGDDGPSRIAEGLSDCDAATCLPRRRLRFAALSALTMNG